MPTVEKEKQVAELRERFSRAVSVVGADYRGVTAGDMDLIRAKLRVEKVELKILFLQELMLLKCWSLLLVFQFQY